jgi:serralysin
MCVLCHAFGSELDGYWHSGSLTASGLGADAFVGATGATVKPLRAFANAVGQNSTGDQEADGLLSGYKWNGTVTYSFPDSSFDYPSGYGYGEPARNFGQITSTQQQVLHRIMGQIGDVTNVSITFAGTDNADIRIARSSEANPTAYAYYPSNSWRAEGSDIWFGTSYNYGNPLLGDYSFLTHIHEIGHAFGLKHSHESGGVAGALPSAHDALEFTVMAYRSYPGGPTNGGYTNEAFGYPQSWMMNDILALQNMYGADYGTHSGNSTYTARRGRTACF